MSSRNCLGSALGLQTGPVDRLLHEPRTCPAIDVVRVHAAVARAAGVRP